MKIDRILAGIREAQSAEKQASEAPAAPAAVVAEKAASSALVTALNEALSSSSNEKVASAPSPADDVMKVAQEIASAEKEAAEKEARILGAAFADSAISRLEEWNKAAAEMLVNGGSEKVSSDQLEQAAMAGYKQARADLEKEAEESYVQGYNDTVEAIHKTAAVEFLKAAALTGQLIEAAQAK